MAVGSVTKVMKVKTAPAPTAPRERRSPPRARRSGRRGRIVAALAVLTSLLMLLHDWIPNRIGNFGSLVQTFLPWTGAAVVLLLAAALLRRSRVALIAVLLPAFTWAALHGGTFLDRGDGGAADLTVVTHNVDDVNPDPAGTARALAACGAQLIALEELTEPAVRGYEQTLAGTHPYHVVEGTVGLWSTYPLRDTAPVAIMPWTRATGHRRHPSRPAHRLRCPSPFRTRAPGLGFHHRAPQCGRGTARR